MSLPKKEFVWGPVVQTHEIGPYKIVEYHPEIFKNCGGTGKYDTKTKFHIYTNGRDGSESCQSLDEALAVAIAKRHDGPNSQAGYYFIRGLRPR